MHRHSGPQRRSRRPLQSQQQQPRPLLLSQLLGASLRARSLCRYVCGHLVEVPNVDACCHLNSHWCIGAVYSTLNAFCHLPCCAHFIQCCMQGNLTSLEVLCLQVCRGKRTRHAVVDEDDDQEDSSAQGAAPKRSKRQRKLTEKAQQAQQPHLCT